MTEDGLYEDCLECGGLCCQAITLPLQVFTDRGFFDQVPHGWRPISLAEAFEINPHLGRIEENCAFFTCDHLNNGRCSIYDRRPKICSEYPFYGDKEFHGPFYTPHCFYRAPDAAWAFESIGGARRSGKTA